MSHPVSSVLSSVALAVALVVPSPSTGTLPAQLQVHQYIADSTAFNVNSVLITGATEAVLIDAQYHLGDAQRVADQIAATGKRLKAIFITHPDHDHYAGAAAIVGRFPGTPVYMTEAAIRHFDTTAVRDFTREKASGRPSLPDSLVTPTPLPFTTLTVDGEEIQIVADLQGDVLIPTNSVIWIPSLRTVIAADLVFNGVHVWLGSSNAASRAAWVAMLRRMQELDPAVVIAGHKPSVDTPDTPEVVGVMIKYLEDFEAARARSQNPGELVAAMSAKYPWKVMGLLRFSAGAAFRP